MHVVNMRKKDDNVIVIPKSYKVATGHRAHITGAGVHHDKRLKRQKTRSNQKRKALAEW